jgi:hypothetical protein
MHSSNLTAPEKGDMKVRIGVVFYAVLALVLALASSSPAAAATGYAGGVPWQTGDIVVCFGTGACNVLRIVNGNAVLLDQFTDNLGGNTYGVAMNNSLHVVATDDAGAGTSKSKVVVYSVASLNPNTNPITTLAHSPVYTYDSSGGNGSAMAVAFDNGGNIYVLNNTGTNPTIVELGPGPAQTSVATFSLSHCGINQATSMDLSADASSAYVTSGGTIQKVTLTPGTPPCTKFADFGSGVTLFGIKDIPPNALPATCTTNVSCPVSETLLVIAKGFVDLDSGETGESSESGNPDAVNICTNSTGGSAESCALLLSATTTTPALSGVVWQASHIYGTADIGTQIIDAFLHVQKVVSAGKSGADEPGWSQTGETVRDNAVVWTDQGQSIWRASTTYPRTDKTAPLDIYIVDTNNPPHVQKASPLTGNTSGTTSPNGPPTFSDTQNGGGQITDGLIWTDQGAAMVWQPTTAYGATGQPQFVIDTNMPPHVQQAQNSGTSGSGTPSWNDGATPGGQTPDGTIMWIDRGPAAYQPGHVYNVTDAFWDSGTHVQQATSAGTAGTASPAFTDIQGTPTPDNAVIWTDRGPWLHDHTYSSGELVGDPAQHIQKETTAGFSGPGPNPPTFLDGTAGVTTTVDGLQWQDQSTSPAVIARYRVNSSQTSLQSLALDPLIVDCTAGCSYPLSLKVTSVITSPGSNPTLTAPGFWLGDNQYPNVWKLDFASGTPVLFSANGPEGTPCSTGLPCAPVAVGVIQGLGIYASEGANQPGLARLLFSTSNTAANNQTGFFPSSTEPNTALVKNSLELTLLNGSSPAPFLGPFALYASPVAPGSCFDDSPGNPLCLGTFQPGGTALPIMWKNDIPLPSSGNLTLGPTQTLAGNFDFPTNFQSLSNDVQLDSLFDTTTLVGLDLPGFTKPSTVHGRRQKGKNNTEEQDLGCALTSPVISPSHSCYANPGTIPIKLSCSGLTANQMSKYGVTSSTPWGPNFQVVRFPQAPIPIPNNFSPPPPVPVCNGTASTGSAPSSANAGNNSPLLQPGGCTVTQLPSSNGATTANCKNSACTYNWVVQSTSQGAVYQILAYDDSDGTWFSPTNPKKGKPVSSGFFYVKNSCP